MNVTTLATDNLTVFHFVVTIVRSATLPAASEYFSPHRLAM